MSTSELRLPGVSYESRAGQAIAAWSHLHPRVGQHAPHQRLDASGSGQILARIVHALARMSVIFSLAGIALAAWAIALYNLLVRDRARVAAAWSDVGVQLKLRHDLIPSLVEVVKQHAGYERSLLERVAQARAQAQAVASPADRRVTEASLGRDMQRLVAVAEAYPDLKASQSFLDLQRKLSDVEDAIQHARRYYNGAVNNLNMRVDSFPDVLIAHLFAFHAAEYFELDGVEEGQPVEAH